MSKITAVAVIVICGVILRMETLFFASGEIIKEDVLACEQPYVINGGSGLQQWQSMCKRWCATFSRCDSFDVSVSDNLGVICTCLLNKALGRPTEQSSTHNPSNPSYQAVDGRHDSGLARTNPEPNPWWSVDLETTLNVTHVAVTAYVGQHLRDFDVTVSTDNIDPDLAADSTLCYSYVGAVADKTTETITCDQPVTGRYVSIQIMHEDRLALREVEVYCLLNQALGKPTEQSSTHSPTYSSTMAVDGNHVSGSGATFTTSESNPWWSVDLETTLRVTRVVVTAGQGQYLHEFDVTVSTDNMDPTLATDSTLCYSYTGAVANGATEILSCDQPVSGR